MSVENLKKFGLLCEEDESVRARAKKIGINDPDGLMEYASKELGLEFTRDDMMELAKEAGVSKDELSEEDLEKIAGGAVFSTLVDAVGSLVGSVVNAVGSVAIGTVHAVGAVVSDW